MTLGNYTVFCQEIDQPAGGTIWISTISATSKKEAMQFAIENCASDWECEPADVVALGVAEGDVNILAWHDCGYTYGELTTAEFCV